MAELDIKIPTTKLPDGTEIPMLGFGVGTAHFKKPGDTSTDQGVIDSAVAAIKLGYTHLDGAETYGNESELGTAIKKSGVAREKLFVTTKVFETIDDIPRAIDTSLKKLGLDYVDLFLIHQPWFAEGDKTRLQTAWVAMEQVLAEGKAKAIGVSNFRRSDLEAVLETAKVRPAINQIEFHPYLQHRDLITYSKNQNVRTAAYAPQVPVTKAAGGPLDPKLAELARKYAVNAGDILLRWAIDQGIVTITTSTKEQRLSDYLRVCTFNLTPKEVEDISEIGDTHHVRAFGNDHFAPDDRS